MPGSPDARGETSMSTVRVLSNAGVTVATYANATVTREPFSGDFPDSDVLIVTYETGSPPKSCKAVHRIAPGMGYVVEG